MEAQTDNYMRAGTVTVGTRLAPEIREVLEELAENNFRTLSQEVRKAVYHYLETDKEARRVYTKKNLEKSQGKLL